MVAIVLAILVWPWIGMAALRAWEKNRNRVQDWLPAQFPETQSLLAFVEKFGSDEFFMVSWPDGSLEDPRFERLSAALLSPASDGETYFASALSGATAIQSLVDHNPGMSRDQALTKLEGLFVGPDRQQSCLIATLSKAGLRDRERAVQWLCQAAAFATELPADQIHIAGSTMDAIAVDAASRSRLLELTIVSQLVCLILLAINLGRFWLVMCVFLISIFNQQLALAIIYWMGGHVDSIQLLVANLAFVLSISAGLHYLGYFREQVNLKRARPAISAMWASAVPSALAAITTSLGFVSLCTSQIVPIRNFGFFAALVVPINSILVIGLLTIHAEWAASHSWRWQHLALAASGQSKVGHARGFSISSLVAWMARRPVWVIVAWLVLVVSLGYGIRFVETSVGTHKLLPAQSKLLHDYAWLESHVGPLVPVEVVVEFPAVEPQRLVDRLLLVESLQQRLKGIPQIGQAMSVVNFISELPSGKGTRHIVRKVVAEKKLTQELHQFQTMRFLSLENDQQAWRISGRVSGSDPPDYQMLLGDIRQLIDRFKEEHADVDLAISVSGGVPIIYSTQRQLLQDLINSFSSAFAMIALSMAVLFRSIRAGLLSMLPNVTPAACVFGTMGHLGWELELGTVLTASVIMGVCVDDTLHLISHFRMARQQGLDNRHAVEDALANCGGAMVHTALVCGLGMLVFVLSPFTPISRFAWLTFALLMVGLISDLVLTPAILLTPLHRVFWHGRK